MLFSIDNLRQANSKSTKAREEDKIVVVIIDIVMISNVTEIDTGQLVETVDSIDKIEVDQNMNKITEEEILEVMQECIKILKDQIVEDSTKIIIEMMLMAKVEKGTGL